MLEGRIRVSSRARRTTFLAVSAGLVAALALGPPLATAPLAQQLRIIELGHFTENRGWNEAGLAPTYQTVVTATVIPSGTPTLVVAEQNGVRQPVWHLPMSVAPHVYVYLRHFQPVLLGSWRIIAERGEARGIAAWTPVLAKPQEVPLVQNVRVMGTGAEPRVSWEMPDLTGFDIDRIRVGVRGGKRLHGRFLDLLYISAALPPSTTDFAIPPGVLASGERYVFQVMLEDLEGGLLENRSLTFSEPYTVSR